MKENVSRWTMTVDRRAVGKNGHVAAWHAANHDVTITRADENAAGNEKIPGAGFLNVESAALVQAFREHLRKTFRHVLNDKNACGKVRRNLRENVLKSVRAAGGNADSDNAVRSKSGARPLLLALRGIIGNNRGGELAAGSTLGDFDFLDQLIADGIEMTCGGVLRLLNKIDGPESEGLQLVSTDLRTQPARAEALTRGKRARPRPRLRLHRQP